MVCDQSTHRTHELPGNDGSDKLFNRLLRALCHMCCTFALLASTFWRSRLMGTTCHSNTAAALLLWLCLIHQSLTSLEHLVLDEPGEKYQPGYSICLERQQ